MQLRRFVQKVLNVLVRKLRVFCRFQEHHKLHELINTTAAATQLRFTNRFQLFSIVLVAIVQYLLQVDFLIFDIDRSIIFHYPGDLHLHLYSLSSSQTALFIDLLLKRLITYNHVSSLC